MTEAIFTLNDGRKLSYAVYGPENGKPVLYFHGTPSSRRKPLLLQAYGVNLQDLLYRAGIRLIAPDRHGLTTFSPHRTFYSSVDDVWQLLQHLAFSNARCFAGRVAVRMP